MAHSSSASKGDEIRDHYAELAQLLNRRRDEIIHQVRTERAHADEQIANGPGDEADISVLDTSADYFLKLASVHQRELDEIRDAIDRMNRGVYGICQSCANDIPLERLKHLPYARVCVDCQSAIENTRLSRRLQSIPKM